MSDSRGQYLSKAGSVRPSPWQAQISDRRSGIKAGVILRIGGGIGDINGNTYYGGPFIDLRCYGGV
jgi:hypothetical protein